MPTLNWIGKEKVISHHQEVPYRILEPQYTFVDGKKVECRESGNKIIHGDNLEALKSLLPEYEGRVKCIYIDPPYNTGNEGWAYNDNVNSPKISKWLGEVVGKEGEDLTRHDKWLCMMYPRLKLLHKLLSNDGAIFISIDDNEQANLRILMDEIFGGKNFVSTIIWQKVYSPKNSAKFFSEDHDFILVYAKNVETCKINQLPRTEKQLSRYRNPDNDPRGPWKSGDLSARNFYSEGTYPITAPSGRVIPGPPTGNYWRVSKSNFEKLDKGKRIWWGENGDNVPAIKRFLSEVQGGVVPQTLWKYEDVGHTQSAKKELHQVLDYKNSEDVFVTPKPSSLIYKVLQIATDKDSIVLDSFAGSGTTAHSVLSLNKEDGGSRKFILVEMEEYADELTAERVKRVISGYGEGTKKVAGKGGEFTYYQLGEPLFNGENELNESVPLHKIREYIYYTETNQPLSGNNSLEDEHILGVNNGTAYYLYYKKESLTTLNYEFLHTIKRKAEQYVIYADNCLLPKEFMDQHNIIFKKIPRDITRF
jgi:adenine-specific DNA-methyltransferase